MSTTISRSKRADREKVRWTPEQAASSLIVIGALFPVAGGRWGSYVGISSLSLYASDLLILLGVAGVVLSRLRHGSSIPMRKRWVTVLSTVVLAVGLIGSSGFNVNVARDAAPFLYFLLTPFFVIAVENFGRDRIMNWFGWASLLHLAWYLPASLGLLTPVSIPAIAGIPLFTRRGDFDTIIVAVTCIWIFWKAGVPFFLRLLVAVTAIAVVLLQGSRAGLLSAALIVAAYLIFARPWSRPRVGPYVVIAGSLSVGAIAASLLLVRELPSWALGIDRLLGESDSAAARGAQNTANARFAAWDLIWQHANNDAGSLLFGYGFGSNFIIESGAVAHLSGHESVRQAHNFFYTWLGLVGMVGAVLAMTMIALMLVDAARSSMGDPVRSLAFAVTSAVVLASFVGVILESPFGYQTFLLGFAIAVARSDLQYSETHAAMTRGATSEAPSSTRRPSSRASSRPG